MRLSRLLPAVFACLSASAWAARPMTLQDLLTAIRVTEPQLSPDGKWVAYVRTTTDVGAGKRNGDLWLRPADGSGEPRQLTRSEKSDSAPRFSPDGRSIAFLSSRDGAPQVYLLPLAGGEARKLTSLTMGVSAPLVFSPDGKRVAFVSDVYPECADEACNKKRHDDAEKTPISVHHLTRLLYRHWNEWRTDVRHHVLVADVESGAVKDVTPGDFDSPTVQYEDASIAFSPDSRELAFVSNRAGLDKEAWSTNMDVLVVPVDGGAAEKVTTGNVTTSNVTTSNAAADINPLWLPDGRLLVRAQRRAGFEADRWYLDVYDRKTKTKRTLFPEVDLSVEQVTLSDDGRTVYFVAEDNARAHLYSVPVEGGTPRKLIEGGALSAVSAGKDRLLYLRASLTSPAEIYTAALDGSSPKAITRENEAWRREVSFTQPESATVKGAAGASVQYWIVKPPDFDPARKYPVVFMIHGGPQGAWLDGWSYRWNPSLWAAQGWVLVAPNPRGSSGFGQKFLDEVSQDWNGKVMTDLFAVFDAVVKLPYVDKDRQAVAGASYGGYAVNWILGQTPRFKAAVTHDGVFNLESNDLVTEELWFTDWERGGEPWSARSREVVAKQSPHLFAHKIVTPTLIITNELDFRVPVDQGLQLFTVLKRRGVPAEALVFPDEGHWVLKPHNSQRWHETVFGWLGKYLK